MDLSDGNAIVDEVHLTNCQHWDRCINENEYTKCWWSDLCVNAICKLGCLHLHDTKWEGICSVHYVQYCDKRGWNSNLSYCLNIRCDRLKISPAQRRDLLPSNLKARTGLIGGVEHFSQSMLSGLMLNNKSKRVKPTEKRRNIAGDPIAGRIRSSKSRPDYEESAESKSMSLEDCFKDPPNRMLIDLVDVPDESSDHDDIDRAEDSH